MKELLEKLTKNYVVIGFKSGNTMECAVIEAVKGNVVMVTYNDSITIIEISQIAYVTPQAGIVEVVQSIFNSEEVKPGEIKPEEVRPEEVKPEEVTPEEIKPEEVMQEEVKPEENNDPKKDSGQGKKKSKHHHHHH